MTIDDQDSLQSKLGQQIRSLRIDRKYSLRKLAIAADMEHHQLIKIEQGRVDVRLSTLKKIADALDIEISVLFSI